MPAWLSLIRCLCLLILPLWLSGCGAALDNWEAQNSFMVAAPPLCEDDESPVGTCPKISDAEFKTKPQEYLGRVINESETKCGRFISGLTLAANTSSTALDSATTVFSALGGIFSPLALVHAMAAGSTITSGWSGVIKSDIYAQRTVENYAQAIQQSYYGSLQDYVNQLGNAQPDKLVESIEVAKIRWIHKNCSLASAQATISATLQASNSSVQASDTTVTVNSPVQPGSYSITGSNGLVASYSAVNGDSPGSVANALVGKIGDPANNFMAANVSASLVPGNTGSFKLHGPSSVTWTVSTNMTIASAASTTATVAPGNGPGTGGIPSAPAAPGTSLQHR